MPCKNGPLCRKFQEGTCPYGHDFSNLSMNGASQKKSFNVESPAFTPKSPSAVPAQTHPVLSAPRQTTIAPATVNAAAFTPRGSGTVTPASSGAQSKQISADYVPQQQFQTQQTFQEFVPQNFVPHHDSESQSLMPGQVDDFSDPFLTGQTMQGMDIGQQPLNPYAEQSTGVVSQPFYTDASQYQHPLNYHLYAAFGQRPDHLLPHQRATSDFFIPDDLREDLQHKSEATLQVYSNSTLPQSIDNHFHSLVALDLTQQHSSASFGYPNRIYKASSNVDGRVYALRRIEGFRLTSHNAINTKLQWKKVISGSLVRFHDAFTTSAFGDRSLVVVTDYFPHAITLAEKHFSKHSLSARTSQFAQEHELWGYVVQVTNALKVIHTAGLAARTINATKILVTSKNRIRVNGCGILDILQYDQHRSLEELQIADLEDLGRLILSIAARNTNVASNTAKALESINKLYSEKLLACVQWLLSPPKTIEQNADFNVHTLLANIADQVISIFDSALSLEDELTHNLVKELENGRLARLMMKLNVILERPESTPAGASLPAASLNQPSSAWSETGERYYLKLFRDYVFHQVDHDGRPVLDLGHIVTCLNKLDVGIDEKVQLVSRDEQNVFVVSYKEVKRGFETAWMELSRGAHAARR